MVLPARYIPDTEPGRLRNEDAIINHARRLASRLERLISDDTHPLVLGSDCSLLIAAGLALARRGRYGPVHLDGHTDFRHPGNNPHAQVSPVKTLP